jgi:hypothetical protein
MKLNLIFFASIAGMFFIGCQSDVDDRPRVIIYTTDETLLPVSLFLDSEYVGALTTTALLTQVTGGDTFPPFGSPGTFSKEVSEGRHDVAALSRPFIAGLTGDSTDITRNLQDAFTLTRHYWRWEFDGKNMADYLIPVKMNSPSGKSQQSAGGEASRRLPRNAIRPMPF